MGQPRTLTIFVLYWSGTGVNGEDGSDEASVLRTRYQGKRRKFDTDSLAGQYTPWAIKNETLLFFRQLR